MSEREMARIKQEIRATTDARDKERLQVVPWATRGQHSLEALARLAGRARSTIQIWLDDFTAGGLTQLLERTAPPGKPSPVAAPKVQEQLQAGLQAGRWRTAGQVAGWLQQEHGIKRAAKSLYYWLGKAGGALPSRPLKKGAFCGAAGSAVIMGALGTGGAGIARGVRRLFHRSRTHRRLRRPAGAVAPGFAHPEAPSSWAMRTRL
jgi:transposase